jgi:hypothetical protein
MAVDGVNTSDISFDFAQFEPDAASFNFDKVNTSNINFDDFDAQPVDLADTVENVQDFTQFDTTEDYSIDSNINLNAAIAPPETLVAGSLGDFWESGKDFIKNKVAQPFVESVIEPAKELFTSAPQEGSNESTSNPAPSPGTTTPPAANVEAEALSPESSDSGSTADTPASNNAAVQAQTGPAVDQPSSGSSNFITTAGNWFGNNFIDPVRQGLADTWNTAEDLGVTTYETVISGFDKPSNLETGLANLASDPDLSPPSQAVVGFTQGIVEFGRNLGKETVKLPSYGDLISGNTFDTNLKLAQGELSYLEVINQSGEDATQFVVDGFNKSVVQPFGSALDALDQHEYGQAAKYFTEGVLNGAAFGKGGYEMFNMTKLPNHPGMETPSAANGTGSFSTLDDVELQSSSNPSLQQAIAPADLDELSFTGRGENLEIAAQPFEPINRADRLISNRIQVNSGDLGRQVGGMREWILDDGEIINNGLTGANKLVFEYKPGWVIAYNKPESEFSILDEAADYEKLRAANLPIPEYGLAKLENGTDALLMKEYQSSNRDPGVERYYNENSLRSLDHIENTMKTNGISINDLQFFVDKDGPLVIADPLWVHEGLGSVTEYGLNRVEQAVIDVTRDKINNAIQNRQLQNE